MPRKRKVATTQYPEGWVVTLHVVVNGRHVEPGTELKIRGERGRFRFVKHVKNTAAPGEPEWIDVIGGTTGYIRERSFHLDRVRTVHRKSKMRPGKKAA